MERAMQKNPSEESSFVTNTASKQVFISGGFLVLIAFAILDHFR